MSESEIFPEICIRAIYGDRVELIDISFNRYGGCGYQVRRQGDGPGLYWFCGDLWFYKDRWRCTNQEFMQDDMDAIGEAIELVYGIEKARNPVAFIV